jgi:hypothetical protein
MTLTADAADMVGGRGTAFLQPHAREVCRRSIERVP